MHIYKPILLDEQVNVRVYGVMQSGAMTLQ